MTAKKKKCKFRVSYHATKPHALCCISANVTRFVKVLFSIYLSRYFFRSTFAFATIAALTGQNQPWWAPYDAFSIATAPKAPLPEAVDIQNQPEVNERSTQLTPTSPWRQEDVPRRSNARARTGRTRVMTHSTRSHRYKWISWSPSRDVKVGGSATTTRAATWAYRPIIGAT